MKVLVLADTEWVDADDPQFTRRIKHRRDVVEPHVVSALRRLGHHVTLLPFDATTVRTLRRSARTHADLVFNLTEGPDGDRRKDVSVVTLLESLRLPYTGTGPNGLALCRDKARSKRLLRRAGFHVPRFQVLKAGGDRTLSDLSYPVLVKPLMADASELMSRQSLAHTPSKALARAALLQARTNQPVICEEFIDGRELKIALLGNGRPKVLPPREVRFGSQGRGGPTFITSRVKGDPEYRHAWEITYPRARLSQTERRLISSTAVRMYQLLDMRGYGKIDVRMTPDGRVVFLEGNPNPDLSPSGFGRIAGWGGVGYTDLIRRIVRLAMTRRTGRESERGGA